MDTISTLKTVLDTALNLQGATGSWTTETRLLGSLPELDSLAVVNVITTIESTFKISIYDDEINADIFATLGALAAFVDQKRKSA